MVKSKTFSARIFQYLSRVAGIWAEKAASRGFGIHLLLEEKLNLNQFKLLETMLTLINQEMLFMNHVEVAPHNYGSKGKYENVAGSLLAFACYKSFELGENYYLGYLSFDSKTELIALYQNKYGATFAMGQKMYFDPKAGKRLMNKYLRLKFGKEE